MEHEMMEHDRIVKIQNTVHEYGEENFAISYSGGKDSNIVHVLFDLAMPGNRIPRVYVNTGIELRSVREFVEEKAKHDSRIHIIQPQRNVKEVLETYGYPFKSKNHSANVYAYYNTGLTSDLKGYIERTGSQFNIKKGCPKVLKYQFTPENRLKISDKCCVEMKEKPLYQWQKAMGKPIAVVGIRQAEGGRRVNAKCLAFKKGKLEAFQPLVPVSDEFEDWFIEKHHIELPSVYGEPFNFKRTGCKGCPFALELQDELDTLEKLLPAEKAQCEMIWGPVYKEYRRLGYRLRRETDDQD